MNRTFTVAMRANFHTHTRYSDGTGEPGDFAKEALVQGYRHLGFSDHAPVRFDNRWSLKWADADDYIRETTALQRAWRDKIQLFRALELDYIPGITYPFNTLRERFALDYTIGSVHLVKHPEHDKLWFIDGPDEEEYIAGIRNLFHNDAELAVSCFYRQQIEMVMVERPDILGHFDKIKMHNKGRFFSGNEAWMHGLQRELIAAVRKTGTIVEVNTRGIYKGRSDELYPSETLIRACVRERIPLMLSSDAHQPSELSGYFDEALYVLKGIGVRKLMLFDSGKFRPADISGFSA